MTLRVRVSQRAEQDADDIFLWIAARSRDGALRWYEKYLSVLRELPETAASSPSASEADDLGWDLRETLFKTRRGRVYRLVFFIRDATIHILSVRGAGQDLLQQGDLELPE